MTIFGGFCTSSNFDAIKSAVTPMSCRSYF